MTIEMVRDVLNWDLDAESKIAMISLLLGHEHVTTLVTYKFKAEPTPSATPDVEVAPKPKTPVHKGPVAGTYRRGLLWARCKKEHPKWAAKQVYGNLSNVDMEKFLARVK